MDATLTAAEHFQRGLELLDAGDARGAFEHLRAAHGLDRDNPRYRSYYGLGVALLERNFNRALELCKSAAKEEFDNAELYHNLARVHLSFGFKPEAIRFLRRGLMIDLECSPIHAELERLGVRRPPVLTFLPRRHPVNRWLGRARLRLATGGRG